MNYEDEDEPISVAQSQFGPMSIGAKFTMWLGVILLIAFCFGGVRWVEYLPGVR